MKKKELERRIKELEERVRKMENERDFKPTIVIPPWVDPRPKDDYVWRDDLDGTAIPRPVPQWRITC